MRLATRAALLTVLWLLAWGDISVANVASGIAVSTAVVLAVPIPRSPAAPSRLRPFGVLRLTGYVVVQLVTSNIVMTREILRRRPTTAQGVLAHELDRPSDRLVTVMTSVIALSPGTMTVDVDASSSTIYVHFLFLRDLDAARAGLTRLERVASQAIGGDQTERGTT